MENPLSLLLIITGTTVIAAAFISFVFKKLLIPNEPESFKQTFKFSLIGTLLGLVIFFVAWYIKKVETDTWDAPGTISTIPFYTMLIGQFVGVYLTTKNSKGTKQR
jgi:drug/metabolite transporter (DMT)-like permease